MITCLSRDAFNLKGSEILLQVGAKKIGKLLPLKRFFRDPFLKMYFLFLGIVQFWIFIN